MSGKTKALSKFVAFAMILAVGSFYPLISVSTLAQTAWKGAGDMSIKGSVTVNGTTAISGATVFNESKIKTSRNSAATINLGKLGRVQLGPESEITLRFSEGLIGGKLTAGRTIVNANAGVAISVATAEGVATSDGNQASALTVDVACGNTRVAATRNSAKVTTSGAKVEHVAAGKEVAVGQAQAPRCTRLTTSSGMELSKGGIAALVVAGVGGATAGIIAATQSDETTPTSIVVSGFQP
ncbi:MAG: hypothetical protein L0220_25405 [Acidobacteria bacterium]|nr:hypothetical protein [Acidobacteriota bacterium]